MKWRTIGCFVKRKKRVVLRWQDPFSGLLNRSGRHCIVVAVNIWQLNVMNRLSSSIAATMVLVKRAEI